MPSTLPPLPLLLGIAQHAFSQENIKVLFVALHIILQICKNLSSLSETRTDVTIH